MSLRNTTTGRVLEEMVIPALRRGGYLFDKQITIGKSPSGGRLVADVIAWKRSETIPVSLKWQQVGGTAEQKVPYEVICLSEAVLNSNGKFLRAYLVLGGSGWKLRDFYVKGGLAKHIKNAELVTVLTLEDFVARANGGLL